MPEPALKSSSISHSSGDRLIRAMVADGNVFHPRTFPESEVQGVEGLEPDRSALVLRSGVKIPTTLSYEDLEQKIYTTDFRTADPILDLRKVTGEAVNPRPAVNSNRAPEPGDKMPDGTIYAGVSPDTCKAMYATPTDASLTMSFNEAKEYAGKLDAHGHKDWHVPTKAELKVLFNNRAAVGGFSVTGSNPAGWYWSSSQYDPWTAWGQRFSDGAQSLNTTTNHSPVRCVR